MGTANGKRLDFTTYVLLFVVLSRRLQNLRKQQIAG